MDKSLKKFSSVNSYNSYDSLADEQPIISTPAHDSTDPRTDAREKAPTPVALQLQTNLRSSSLLPVPSGPSAFSERPTRRRRDSYVGAGRPSGIHPPSAHARDASPSPLLTTPSVDPSYFSSLAMRKAPEPLKRLTVGAPPVTADVSRYIDLVPKRRLLSYCTAKSYDLIALSDYLKRLDYKIEFHDDVCYSCDRIGHRVVEGFYFEFGCLILWGMEPSEEKRLLELLKPYQVDPLEPIEFDDMTFTFGKSTIIEGDDEVFLRSDLRDNEQDLLSAKLAISHALAQSIKLASFEENITDLIEGTQGLTQALSKTGKIPLNRRQIAKYIGELFLQRNEVNLQSGIIDTPSWFWDHPDVEGVYNMARKYLEIGKRVDIMNKKLESVKELFEILNNEMQSQHSTSLEWIVIVLILVEILLTVLGYIYDYFSEQ